MVQQRTTAGAERMGEYRLHSLIIAAEYAVDDVDEVVSRLRDRESDFAEIDAHHLVIYTSMWGPNRILVTVGIRRDIQHHESVTDVLRSPAVFDIFSDVDEIPAIFAGRIFEKIDMAGGAACDDRAGVPGVVVGVIARVDDVATLVANVHAAADRFIRAGVRKVWVYSAADDSHEVMVLQEIGDEVSARRWLNRPDEAAEWMTNAGFGVSPKVFVGRLAHILSIGADSPVAAFPAEKRVG